MPIHKMSQRPDSITPLVDDLKSEWLEAPVEGQEAPDIFLFEPEGQFQPVHVYVAWDRWSALDQETRSEIIMRAYEQVDEAKAVRVTLAMGLTKAEARAKGMLE
jgi:hypothetical protein